jgi:hypothetical protein
MLGILGGPIVPFIGITSGTWMKLVAHVSINLREAQQATYSVRQIKNSICSFCATRESWLANSLFKDHPYPQHLIIPKISG